MLPLFLIGALGLAVIGAAAAVLAKTSGASDAVVSEEFGLRTRFTKHCDECWRAGHRAATPALRLTAIVSGGLVALLIVLPMMVGTLDDLTVVAVVAVAGAYMASIGLMLIATHRANVAARGVHGADG